jgi:hypothetical protein
MSIASPMGLLFPISLLMMDQAKLELIEHDVKSSETSSNQIQLLINWKTKVVKSSSSSFNNPL